MVLIKYLQLPQIDLLVLLVFSTCIGHVADSEILHNIRVRIIKAFIRMIARFYDVKKGAIKIGGADIRQLDYNTMMNNIAITFQDVYLFDTTIQENLLIAKPDPTEAKLKEAATVTQLDEMLERLQIGWDTKTGESSLQLSGGERQKVSIARAFLKKARIY